MHILLQPSARRTLSYKVFNLFFKYTSFPFGLAIAPKLFCLFTSTVTYFCKRLKPELFCNNTPGRKSTIGVYLDDFFMFHQNKLDAEKAFDFLEDLLISLGFKLSKKESGRSRAASKVIVLGLELNFEAKSITIPESKKKKYLSAVAEVLDNKNTEKLSLIHI